jgi:hypothetical protein
LFPVEAICLGSSWSACPRNCRRVEIAGCYVVCSKQRRLADSKADYQQILFCPRRLQSHLLDLCCSTSWETVLFRRVGRFLAGDSLTAANGRITCHCVCSSHRRWRSCYRIRLCYNERLRSYHQRRFGNLSWIF